LYFNIIIDIVLLMKTKFLSILFAVLFFNLSAEVQFRIEPELEKVDETRAELILERFLSKGGRLQVIEKESDFQPGAIRIRPGDAVYPICSAGNTRSQILRALLTPFQDKIVLFAPVGARLGWDPYNGRINYTEQQKATEEGYDSFPEFFGIPKKERFAFNLTDRWEEIAKNPTAEGLAEITAYYNAHYYGPNASHEGQKGSRRVFIVFAQNAHVVMHRLTQANERLDDVHLYAIGMNDTISKPLPERNIGKRSPEAYSHFVNILAPLLDTKSLQ
jgi:hypothetical protein